MGREERADSLDAIAEVKQLERAKQEFLERAKGLTLSRESGGIEELSGPVIGHNINVRFGRVGDGLRALSGTLDGKGLSVEDAQSVLDRYYATVAERLSLSVAESMSKEAGGEVTTPQDFDTLHTLQNILA